MEGRLTRSKAKAGTSKIPNNPVTTSKRRRRVEARKLNRKQQTEDQNVEEENVEEENVEQNGEEHNVEKQHIAQISFHTAKKAHNLVTTSERSRRVKARKPNKNQRTVDEINDKEQNGEQNIEEHNVEEQHAAHASFDNSRRPCYPVTTSERNIHVKARKPDKKEQMQERNVNELYVDKQNVEQNIEEQRVEEHIVEEQHTSHISLGSKKTCNLVTASKRSGCVKARKSNKKQRTEEPNVEEETVEELTVKEQHTCDDIGTSSARHNVQISCAPVPLSSEETSIQHEQETISASIQREQEAISTSVQHEQKNNFVEVNQQVGVKKSIEFNHHGETVGPNATHFKFQHEQKYNFVEVNQQVGLKKSIEFNRYGEAVGPNATHFKFQVGKFVRKLVPISYTTWQKVPENYKDAVWNEIVKGFEVPSYMKKNVERSMPSAFRGFKHNLRKYHLDKQPNLEARKLDIPTGIKKEDWEKFCINESSEKQIKSRAQAVQSRKKSSYCHTQGRRSASMIEYEMIAKGNHSVTRTDVWLAAHTRKDGTVLRSAEPLVEKVKAKVDEFKRSGGSGSGHILSIDDDPLAQVLGKKPKALPGVGSNISRSKYEAALHPHVMYSGEKTQRVFLEKKLDKMEAQLDFIVNHCTSQVAREPSTPTTTLVVDDGSSASTAMKKLLLEEENYAQSKSADSAPNARMCELLDWNRKCVAIAKEVTDPTHKAICHDYHLKTEYEVKVSMCEGKILNAKLYKETYDAKRIKDVGVGDFLVWPISHISFLGSEK